MKMTLKDFMEKYSLLSASVVCFTFLIYHAFDEYFEKGDGYRLSHLLLFFSIMGYNGLINHGPSLNRKLLNIGAVVLTIVALIEIVYACYFKEHKIQFDMDAFLVLGLALITLWAIKKKSEKEQALISNEQ